MQYVLKRDGTQQPVSFDKITTRISSLQKGLDTKFVDAAIVAQKVVQGVYPGVTTEELDELAAVGGRRGHDTGGQLTLRMIRSANKKLRNNDATRRS